MSGASKSCFKILLGGYINVNVIDGSAFFLSGFAGMCARHPYVNVDLVTANPVLSWEVLDELAEYSNVDIIDPYSPSQGHPQFIGRNRMTRQEYASVLADWYRRKECNAVLIRDNEVALEFLRLVPEATGHVFAYVTGLTFIEGEQDPDELARVSRIISLGGKLVCQTEEIRNLVQLNLSAAEKDIVLLPPHVPDPDPQALASLEEVVEPKKLVYTGKFFQDWKIDSILAAVKSINLDAMNLHLDVAGDQFRHAEDDKFFVDNVSYLLKHTQGVKWHGRVPRNVSRVLISNNHVGVGWRSNKLDASSELSTKILEYGALGRPSIVNRTAMHEKLLGRDYPLFVNSMSEFRALLHRLRDSRAEILVAATRCFQLAHEHSYTAVSRKILPQFGNVPSQDASLAYINNSDLSDRVPAKWHTQRARVRNNGIWVEFIFDENSESTVGQLASEAEKDLRSWHQAVKITRSRIEAFAQSDSLGGLSEKNQSVRLETQEFEIVKALRESLDQTRSEQEQLERAMQEDRRELSKAIEREAYWREHSFKQTERLDALRGSKLGRLQTRIWRNKG